MAGFFEKLLEQKGYIDFGKKPEKIIEEKENLEGIFNKFLTSLKNFENQKNIDDIIGQNSTSELAGSIQMAKDILEKTGLLARNYSNGKEILRNIEVSFNGFLRREARAKERGLAGNADIIKENYNELKDFTDLIIECKDYREKEFGDDSGYLAENEEESAKLRSNMRDYIEKCKQKIRNRSN